MKRFFQIGLSLALAQSAQAFDLSSSIPYPFYDVQKSAEGKSNKMMILNSGLAALEKRIELIRKAKKHIEVEYFIYALDTSSKILTVELVKAAKRGVKVRMLVDKSAAVFVLDEYYAKALKDAGVELRYYNPAPIYRISSINFRNHRKLISADDQYAITGGRNVEDDYYDFSEEFNFLDRDVYVEGDIVKTMRKSFDHFFEHEIAERPSAPEPPAATKRVRYKDPGSIVWKYKQAPNTKAIQEYENLTAKANAFLSLSEEEQKIAAKASRLGTQVLQDKKLVECPVTTFSSDRPGGDFETRLIEDYSDEYRFLRKTLFDKAVMVDKGLVISSPYMINSPKSMEIYKHLLEQEVSLKVYTNSMASTDALYVAANLYLTVFNWDRFGIQTTVHAGKYIDEQTPTLTEGVKNAKWGTHSKTQLYEYHDSSKNEFMVGTYNYDNRSNHYNTEMGIFCQGSDELYRDVKKSIEKRIGEGYRIHSDYTATDKNGNRVSVLGADKSDLPKMLLMALPSWFLNFLL